MTKARQILAGCFHSMGQRSGPQIFRPERDPGIRSGAAQIFTGGAGRQRAGAFTARAGHRHGEKETRLQGRTERRSGADPGGDRACRNIAGRCELGILSAVRRSAAKKDGKTLCRAEKTAPSRFLSRFLKMAVQFFRAVLGKEKALYSLRIQGFLCGASDVTRTHDLLITNYPRIVLWRVVSCCIMVKCSEKKCWNINVLMFLTCCIVLYCVVTCCIVVSRFLVAPSRFCPGFYTPVPVFVPVSGGAVFCTSDFSKRLEK